MARESSFLSSTIAKLAVSEPVPTNTGSEVSHDNAQYFTRSPIPSLKRNVKPDPEASLESFVPVLVPGFPAQTKVLDQQLQTSTASVTTENSSTICPPLISVTRGTQIIQQSVGNVALPCNCRYLARDLVSAFSTQSLFGNSDSRKVPVSGRTQFRFFQKTPPILGECEAIKTFESGGWVLNEPLSGLLKPIIQAVLDELIRAVGVPGLNPELIIRDDWIFRTAYSFWNTINMPLGQLLSFKSMGSLAYVLAHELGHILAAHQVEGNAVFYGTEYVPELFQSRMRWCHGLGNIGEMMFVNETWDIDTFQKEYCAFRRLGEYEADCIGMYLMAKAGFDPREALVFAREMEIEEPAIFKTTQESVHPQWQNRITILESQLDTAMALFEGAESKESMISQFDEMRRALHAEGRRVWRERTTAG
ncbi:hypothetical protein DL98DRAFT_618127 [Cadophora sp. DSE1049]|nr:hypothetical protein DL98DRAFT_618127 [Cadophora sp. DSE1049]